MSVPHVVAAKSAGVGEISLLELTCGGCGYSIPPKVE